MDETVDMVDATLNLQHFYKHESCGQCTPCREGSGWIVHLVHKIHSGHGTASDLLTIKDVSNRINGHTICPCGAAMVTPVLSAMQKFKEEFISRLSVTHYGKSEEAKKGDK